MQRSLIIQIFREHVNVAVIVTVQQMEPALVLVKMEHACADQTVHVVLACMGLLDATVLKMEHVHVVKVVHVAQKIVIVGLDTNFDETKTIDASEFLNEYSAREHQQHQDNRQDLQTFFW